MSHALSSQDLALLRSDQPSWGALLQREWGEGLRHLVAWHSAEKLLQLTQQWDEEVRPGSWFGLSAKQQWLEGKLTTAGLQQVLVMSRSTMTPDDDDVDWSARDRDQLQDALSEIQSDLSPSEHAWLESDTARYLAHDALTRLVWSTLQFAPPRLSTLAEQFLRVIRHFLTAQRWGQIHVDQWEQAERAVQQYVRQETHKLLLWQKQLFLTLWEEHHHQIVCLCRLLRRRAQHTTDDETRWQHEWEDALYR